MLSLNWVQALSVTGNMMTVYLFFGLILLYGAMALATNVDPENGTPEKDEHKHRIYLPHNDNKLIKKVIRI